MTTAQRLLVPEPRHRSNAVLAMNFEKKQAAKPTFFEIVENLSNVKTVQRLMLRKKDYDKLIIFRNADMLNSVLREDHYYDLPGNNLLQSGLSLRIREDKDENGHKRVTLKFREKECEGSLTYRLSAKDFSLWSESGKIAIPASILKSAHIKNVDTAKKVGVILTTRFVFLDGNATLDSCFFYRDGQNHKDYEVRLKNPDYKKELRDLFANEHLFIPMVEISESRYQRLMKG